jgi:hypothetical protein
MRRSKRYIKVVERLHGLGKLYTRAGDLIVEVGYSIKVRQEFIDGIEGQKDLWGTLSLMGKKRVLGHEHEYTLELEDGRKVDIIIHDPSKDSITFESSGPLE